MRRRVSMDAWDKQLTNERKAGWRERKVSVERTETRKRFCVCFLRFKYLKKSWNLEPNQPSSPMMHNAFVGLGFAASLIIVGFGPVWIWTVQWLFNRMECGISDIRCFYSNILHGNDCLFYELSVRMERIKFMADQMNFPPPVCWLQDLSSLMKFQSPTPLIVQQ